MPAPAPIRISKSKFVAGAQCLKRLYCQVYEPDLAEEADEGQQTRLEQGNEVGRLAQARFPGGVLVGFEQGIDAALAQTACLLEDASVPAIFEATFQHRNILVRVDVLQRRPGNRWRLIEVKSSVAVKDYHFYDVGIQAYVLRGCGLDLTSVCLMHLNGDYIYDGGLYDARHLFTLRNLTGPIRKFDAELQKLLKAERKALALDHPPGILPGSQCCAPIPCEFYTLCNPPVPEHHISYLPRLGDKKRAELLAQGITLITDIPKGFPLTENQTRIWTSVKSGQPWFSDSLARDLSRLKYPLLFMDFETLYPAIPRFEGMWPYSHIPFQWSVQRQMSADSDLEPFDFLAEDGRDPRAAFLDSLIESLSTRGMVVVYNATFESRRLSDLANWIPTRARQIAAIQTRLWDLLAFVKGHVYHPRFHGSFSLKATLPALVPKYSYEGMEVSHGDEAGSTWDQMIHGDHDAKEQQRMKAALLCYCRQDTMAMARVLERLRAVGSNGRGSPGQRRCRP